MIYKLLQRVPDFADLPLFELRAMAERAHILCIPRGRWILRSRQEIPAYLYLARGRIETFEPHNILRSYRHGPISHFYPGCGQARVLQTSQILRIDAAQREFLINRSQTDDEMQMLVGNSWLQEFLRTQLMQQVPQQVHQPLINSFTAKRVSAGDEFIREGDAGAECYVIEEGHAVVHHTSRTIAHIGPGDLFGEDALITGGQRSASVSALDNMVVHAIDHAVFRSKVLDSVVRFQERAGVGELLNIGTQCIPGAQAFSVRTARDMIGQMDPRPAYYITGASRGERALCAFLLISRGFRASPLTDSV
ncbi:MAG: cyclic nucleotide-binding domain-containing protein [Pseudomonadota bacterium]